MQPEFWVPMATQDLFTHDKAMLRSRDSYPWMLPEECEIHAIARVQAEMHLFAQQVDQSQGSKEDLLAGIAGAARAAVAWTMARLRMRLKPTARIPLTLAIPLDWRVMLITAAVSLASGACS
jgi:hypothetical protein